METTEVEEQIEIEGANQKMNLTKYRRTKDVTSSLRKLSSPLAEFWILVVYGKEKL